LESKGKQTAIFRKSVTLLPTIEIAFREIEALYAFGRSLCHFAIWIG